MSGSGRNWASLVALLWLGCSAPLTSTPPAGPPQTVPPPIADVPATSDAPAPPPTIAAASPPPAAPREVRCGAMKCLSFATPAQAFRHVLAQAPRVLALGEAHSRKGTEAIRPTIRRFGEDLLPEVQPKASDLVIELMQPDRACIKVTEEVREAQKPVTQEHAESNQNEFVALGEQAQRLGTRPHILYPNCEQYQRLLDAGDDRIAEMLSLIAELTYSTTRAILERNQRQQHEALVLLYGGAMHNDLAPKPGRERWSYGPALKKLLGPRYIELDLIVRELIRDTESWQGLSWYEHFDKSQDRNRAVLLEQEPGSYVLFFPEEPAASPQRINP